MNANNTNARVHASTARTHIAPPPSMVPESGAVLVVKTNNDDMDRYWVYRYDYQEGKDAYARAYAEALVRYHQEEFADDARSVSIAVVMNSTDYF